MKAVIIGAGASGVACAIRIKQNMPDAEVIILEHLDEACKKLHATGNGRCNLTNRNASGFETTKSFFESIGLIIRESGEGRMYPYSNQASGVVEILLEACNNYGIKIVYGCKVTTINKAGETYGIYSNKGQFYADAVILATGGTAQSPLGSDGSGYILAESLGHSITELSPALVQLKSSSKHCRALKGIRVKCKVSIEINGEFAGDDFGELLFTDYGLSGIVVMNLSEFVNDNALKNGSEKCVAVIDLVPDLSEAELTAHYRKHNSLIGILPKKLCSILSKQAEGNEELIAKYAKNWRIIVTGTKGYSFAQITKGGVSLDELTQYNESKISNELYIIGELTDNQFKCGGFNLDYAFSSGVRCADHITETYDKNY